MSRTLTSSAPYDNNICKNIVKGKNNVSSIPSINKQSMKNVNNCNMYTRNIENFCCNTDAAPYTKSREKCRLGNNDNPAYLNSTATCCCCLSEIACNHNVLQVGNNVMDNVNTLYYYNDLQIGGGDANIFSETNIEDEKPVFTTHLGEINMIEYYRPERFIAPSFCAARFLKIKENKNNEAVINLEHSTDPQINCHSSYFPCLLDLGNLACNIVSTKFCTGLYTSSGWLRHMQVGN